MKKGTKDFFRLVAIFFVAGGFLLLLFASFTWTSKPTYGHGDVSLNWLPDSATNITYMERKGFGGIKVAEFTIAQNPFEEFAKENDWPLESKSDVSVFFKTYAMKEKPDVQNYTPEELQDELYVKKVLFYEKRADNGGGITLVYDIDKQKGYYFYSHN